jgi:hypothetical protein
VVIFLATDFERDGVGKGILFPLQVDICGTNVHQLSPAQIISMQADNAWSISVTHDRPSQAGYWQCNLFHGKQGETFVLRGL